jgi:gamma-glutamyl-gamma-aminobutyrate hydrolase PuuD
VVEAIEPVDKRFVIAIQWHPEILSLEGPRELALFERLAVEAELYREQR